MEGQLIVSGMTATDFLEAVKNMVRAELRNGEPEELLTREQTAEFLQVNIATISTWTSQGRLTCYGMGGRRYYKKSEIMSALEILKV
ncbi:helix-turn-helix domain-containing protein [Myroides odoratimimus]|uniref:helix-turn-helix domain-containing protein n=1 Tax=Myroides odoratimimus TaxID=76832 RepID=UPI00257809EC|nr:helix-turn-helix domain-containing protein [Myroides odoratimimus]MDM1452205.1 helix-turn-helix domain-containing protein [Myroides odoratimimus]MDM1475456.1 helix-turn-helix domain-containing protein [Myroides odoratimimus]MDM1488257.1 helix-turn-helix domain-containing protein [Myroides odoratimimus]